MSIVRHKTLGSWLVCLPFCPAQTPWFITSSRVSIYWTPLWQDPNVILPSPGSPAHGALLEKIAGLTKWCHWKLKVNNFKPSQHAAFPSDHWLPCAGPWIPTLHTFLKLLLALPSVPIPASPSWRKEKNLVRIPQLSAAKEHLSLRCSVLRPEHIAVHRGLFQLPSTFHPYTVLQRFLCFKLFCFVSLTFLCFSSAFKYISIFKTTLTTYTHAVAPPYLFLHLYRA